MFVQIDSSFSPKMTCELLELTKLALIKERIKSRRSIPCSLTTIPLFGHETLDRSSFLVYLCCIANFWVSISFVFMNILVFRRPQDGPRVNAMLPPSKIGTQCWLRNGGFGVCQYCPGCPGIDPFGYSTLGYDDGCARWYLCRP